MKKRFGAVGLVLVMALALAIPAGAANVEQTPEELYQEYLDVAAEINETLGTDISLIPLEDMDPNDMPTVEEVTVDVRELAMMKVSMRNSINAAQTENALIAPCALGTNKPFQYVTGTWLTKEFIFKCSATLVVTTPTGTVNYYFQSHSEPLVDVYKCPSGYNLDDQESTVYYYSTDKKGFTVHRSYVVSYNSATAYFHPTVKFTVSSTSGVITKEILGV